MVKLHTFNIQLQILSFIFALQQPKDPFLFNLKDTLMRMDVGDCAEDLVLYDQL